MEYEIRRISKGTRTYFTPTKNGRRFTKINFARKYDAIAYVREAVRIYGAAKLEEMSNRGSNPS